MPVVRTDGRAGRRSVGVRSRDYQIFSDGLDCHISLAMEQQVVTLRVCASCWTEVCCGIGSQRMQKRKMAPLLKITIVDHRLSHLFYLGGVQIRQSLFCNMRDCVTEYKMSDA